MRNTVTAPLVLDCLCIGLSNGRAEAQQWGPNGWKHSMGGQLSRDWRARSCELQPRNACSRQDVLPEPNFPAASREMKSVSDLYCDKWLARIRFSTLYAIHTFFMRFAIDVAFVSRAMHCEVRTALPPWRIAAAWRALAVVDLIPKSG